jgi:GAF domain-containing protein
MDDSVAFARQLALAARSLQAEPGTQEKLDRAVVVATEIIECCDLAAVSLVRKGGIDTLAATDDSLNSVDRLQFDIGEGPCLATLEMHEIVHSRDLANDGRWPVWGPKAAAEAGVGSVVSYRLFTTTNTLGAMNLYSRDTGRFTTDEIYNGQALAAHVGVALAEARHAENLERAVTTRTVIGQAEGILMERFNITAEQAFNVLRRVSQERNVKLNLIAEELVRTRRTPGTEPD